MLPLVLDTSFNCMQIKRKSKSNRDKEKEIERRWETDSWQAKRNEHVDTRGPCLWEREFLFSLLKLKLPLGNYAIRVAWNRDMASDTYTERGHVCILFNRVSNPAFDTRVTIFPLSRPPFCLSVALISQTLQQSLISSTSKFSHLNNKQLDSWSLFSKNFG